MHAVRETEKTRQKFLRTVDVQHTRMQHSDKHESNTHVETDSPTENPVCVTLLRH